MGKPFIRFCKQADEEHRRSKRQYAHTYHHDFTICFARAIKNLTPAQFAAILAHEIGHLLAGLDHADVERAANRAANEYFGIKILYRDSKNGKRLQTVSRRDLAKIKKWWKRALLR